MNSIKKVGTGKTSFSKNHSKNHFPHFLRAIQQKLLFRFRKETVV